MCARSYRILQRRQLFDHAGTQLLQDPRARVLRARALPSGPNAVHAGAEQVRNAAARVRHAAALQNSKNGRVTRV